MLAVPEVFVRILTSDVASQTHGSLRSVVGVLNVHNPDHEFTCVGVGEELLDRLPSVFEPVVSPR